jgi:hypothetical protein
MEDACTPLCSTETRCAAEQLLGRTARELPVITAIPCARQLRARRSVGVLSAQSVVCAWKDGEMISGKPSNHRAIIATTAPGIEKPRYSYLFKERFSPKSSASDPRILPWSQTYSDAKYVVAAIYLVYLNKLRSHRIQMIC